MKQFVVFPLTVIILSFFIIKVKSDSPCAAMSIPNESVVCVCNSTYCDTITRRTATCGKYIAYTTSKAGLRFNVKEGRMKKKDCNFSFKRYTKVLKLNPSVKYKTVQGFGGAVTDAAGINWMSLSKPAQRLLIESYFGSNGSEYNIIRVPIGASDFSRYPYSYDDDHPDDTSLDYFALAKEDYSLKIPMITKCMRHAVDTVRVMGSLWSPPTWMKTNNQFVGQGYLKDKYFQTLANYFCKFVQNYEKEGIPIYWVTVTNEPQNGANNLVPFQSLGWTIPGMAKWIKYNLSPKMGNCVSHDVKVLGVDDQRFNIPQWLNLLDQVEANATDQLDGVAVHFYFDKIVPGAILKSALEAYPNKYVINTEASIGIKTNENGSVFGVWANAARYIEDMLQDLNYDVVGWVDWNLCLDMQGGPNWAGVYLDAGIIVNAEKQEFYKQPMYYAIAHFSKFLPRGSQRIQVQRLSKIGGSETQLNPDCGWYLNSLDNVAFLTPQNTVVVILYNKNDKNEDVAVVYGSKTISLRMEPASITTLEFLQKSSCSCAA